MSSCCSFCQFPGHTIRQCVSPRSFVLKDELEGFMNINNIHYSYPPIIYQFVLRYSYRDIRMMTVIGRNGLNLNQTKETLTLALVNYICQERQRRYLRREQLRDPMYEDLRREQLRREQMYQESEKNVHTIKFIVRNENEIQTVAEECPICYDFIQPSNLCLTNCKHQFCTECIMKSLKNKSSCPCCREKIVTLSRGTEVPPYLRETPSLQF